MSDLLPNGAAALLLIDNPASPGSPIPVEGQAALSLAETVAEIDTSSKDSPATTVAGGRYGSSGSFSFLYVPSRTTVAAVRAALRERALVPISISEDDEVVERAYVLLTNFSLDLPDQERSEVSVDFTVSGEWSPVSS